MSHLSAETLIDYAHQALDPAADAAAYVHVQSCTPCRQQYDEEIALTEILRSHAAAEEREFPASLAGNILAAVAKAPARSFKQRIFSAWRPLALSMAAVAAFIVTAPHVGGGGPNVVTASTNLTASAFFDRHDAAAADLSLADRTATPEIENSAFVASDQNESSSATTN